MSAPTQEIGQFGPLTHVVSIDRAIVSFLIAWLPTWLASAERRDGKPTRWLARPVFYTTTYDEDDDDFFSDHKMPAVIVTAGELTDWQKTGNENWSATSRCAISIVSRGRSMPESRAQASLYAATVTDLLLAKPSIGGFANGVIPISERPRAIEDPSNRSRHLTAGMGQYDIFVPDVRQGLLGPLLPDPPDDPDAPYDPYPDVETVEVDVVGLPPTMQVRS